MNVDEQRAALREKLDPDAVKKVQGKSYVDGLYVIDLLNKIFGPDGWEDSYDRQAEHVNVRVRPTKDGPKAYTWCSCVAVCRLRVRFGDDIFVVKSGTGAGDGGNYQDDVAQARDLAWKEAETDALKRAARKLGYVFGLSLYDKENPIHQGKMDKYGELPPEVLLLQAANAAVHRGVHSGDIDHVIAQHADGVVDIAAVTRERATACCAAINALQRRTA